MNTLEKIAKSRKEKAQRQAERHAKMTGKPLRGSVEGFVGEYTRPGSGEAKETLGGDMARSARGSAVTGGLIGGTLGAVGGLGQNIVARQLGVRDGNKLKDTLAGAAFGGTTGAIGGAARGGLSTGVRSGGLRVLQGKERVEEPRKEIE